MLTKSRIRNGTAIAAALIAAAETIGAQRPATTRPRDSMVVRLFAPSMVALDSLRTLLQEFDREQYGTPRWVTLRGRIDSLVGVPGAFTNATAFVRGVLASAEARRLAEDRRGWLGLTTQGPSLQLNDNGELRVTQLAHPVIVTVDPQSPAERAGITAGDVLVAYNGVDVVNHEFNLTTLLRPDSKITVTVRRDGETKDYPLVVAKAPQRISERRVAFENIAPARGVSVGRGEVVDVPRGAPTRTIIGVPRERGFAPTMMPGSSLLMIAPNGVFGANVSTVNNELARVLNLRAGVLVTDVPEDSPAFRAGLRIGDVIIAVGDQPIISLSELRNRVLALSRERAVPLQVTSPNQKTRTVSVSLVPSP